MPVIRQELFNGLAPRRCWILKHNAKLCGNFVAGKRWKNCPATAAGYALFVVAPEPEDLHHSLVLEHLVDQTMLNIDAA